MCFEINKTKTGNHIKIAGFEYFFNKRIDHAVVVDVLSGKRNF